MNGALQQIVFIASLMATGVAQPARQAATGNSGWRTYYSSDYGFTINYPADGSFTPGYPVMPARAMIPICGEKISIACFEYDGHAFDNTPIQSLGVSINILREETTEADCADMDDIGHTAQTIVIRGTIFHFAKTGGAAAGSSESGLIYHAFRQHVCFEIALGTSRTDIGAMQYEEAAIHHSIEKTLRTLQDDMDQMLHSFTFMGRVRDAGAWNRYDEPECGGSFEYPADADIEQMILPAREPRLFSPSCAVSFVERDRVYTIAEKANLHNQDEINEWLSTSAFPDLSHARRIGNGVLEFRSSDLAYFVVNGQLFLFAVSNPAPRSPPVRGDPVFAHLLRTFRWP